MNLLECEMLLEKANKEIEWLKRGYDEMSERCSLQGRQIVEMKEKYDILLVEIKILKEGGNL